MMKNLLKAIARGGSHGGLLGGSSQNDHKQGAFSQSQKL
jgi:hypothetical protein